MMFNLSSAFFAGYISLAFECLALALLIAFVTESAQSAGKVLMIFAVLYLGSFLIDSLAPGVRYDIRKGMLLVIGARLVGLPPVFKGVLEM